jgi:hypothetical protein
MTVALLAITATIVLVLAVRTEQGVGPEEPQLAW